MSQHPESIDADIRRAATLPARLYGDAALHETLLERAFCRSWQLLAPGQEAPRAGEVLPTILLEDCLDEPLLLARDGDGVLRCLSNVCTHRGNLVAMERSRVTQLRCGYHGRCFDLAGRLLGMPGFEEVDGFPAASDHLPELPLHGLGPLRFTALQPPRPFAEIADGVRERLGGLLSRSHTCDAARQRDYVIDANWMLYCDNYLEGFHIPFVHPGLHRVLSGSRYRTQLLPFGTLQWTEAPHASQARAVFPLPAGHPDHPSRVAAYYLWLWPNTMLNLYPWGLSVNVVIPEGPRRTRIRFFSYVHDAALQDEGAGGDLHQVELEDDAVVLAVQKGVRSRLYRRGRYSPRHEAAVHHFHRMVMACWQEPG